MALLIPENLRTRADVPAGVNRTARVLQDTLDDAATVWYEPLFDVGGERPDLVALVPDVGILVLEVLEKKSGAIVGTRDGKVVVAGASGERLVDAPLTRAETFADGLAAALARESRLKPQERLGVTAVGVLPFLSRHDGERRGLAQAMSLDLCLFRDDLEAALRDGESLRRRLLRTMSCSLRDPLAAGAEKLHRAVIHPDTVIGSPRLPFPSATPDEELKVLDRRQEALAKSLGEGHRVVRGVAGSGKTLILAYRARLLAESFPRQQVLVTCFNRALAGMLRRQLHHPNVRVQTIESLMEKARINAGIPAMKFDQTSFEQRSAAALGALVDHPDVAGRFDHVLVDEAQDFTTDALAFATRLLRPPSNSLLVVADAAQNIYSNKFRWRDAGINAVGRTRVLDASYRNTREILDYAVSFLLSGDEVKADASLDDETAIIPPRLSLRSGPHPLFRYLETPQQEVLVIADKCRQLIDQGVTPAAIAVLYGSRTTGGFDWPSALNAVLISRRVPVYWVTDPAQPANRDHIGEDPTKVVLSTIHSAKGLEFSHVMMCGYLDDRPPKQRVLNRRLIYVGMTRATQELLLTASGRHDYIADLELGQ